MGEAWARNDFDDLRFWDGSGYAPGSMFNTTPKGAWSGLSFFQYEFLDF